MAEETTPEPQVEKQKKTDKTGLAILALTVIIVAVITVFLVVTYYPQAKVIQIQEGDCIDLNYIGRYASNNTVFDSSYQYWENKSGGTPLNVFVSMNKSTLSPLGYENYSQGIIDGLMDGLFGLKEGQTTTIGPIPPEKAYGNKLTIGSMFYTSSVAFGINTTMKINDLTSDDINIYWTNPEDLHNFTMPQFVIKDLGKIEVNQDEAVSIAPPFFIWENQTTAVTITNDSVLVKVDPTTHDHLVNEMTPFYYQNTTTSSYIFPNATTASWNDTTITITSAPQIGATYPYTFNYYGYMQTITLTVENVTADKINLSSSDGGTKQYNEIYRTFTFNKTFTIERRYPVIPLTIFSMLYGQDLQNQGLSLHELAGEPLLFEVTIEKVYKTSE